MRPKSPQNPRLTPKKPANGGLNRQRHLGFRGRALNPLKPGATKPAPPNK